MYWTIITSADYAKKEKVQQAMKIRKKSSEYKKKKLPVKKTIRYTSEALEPLTIIFKVDKF